MVSSLKSIRFWVVSSGLCFVGALLLQIGSAVLGVFGRLGSVLLALAFLSLAITSFYALLAGWLFPDVSNTNLLPQTVSKIGILCAIAATLAGAAYTMRWAHPTENVTGGNDEGIYTITAANLAHTGSYHLTATKLPTLPAEIRSLVITEMPRMANRTKTLPQQYPVYHACLFLADEKQGTLVSQFPIGFPALLGSAHALFGMEGQRFVNPILLFITACLAGVLITSWGGLYPGCAVFIMWLWFPLHVWAGNTRFAELLLQCLWILTLICLMDRVRHSILAAGLAGLALGASLAVKVDALPIVFIVGLATLAATFREKTFCRMFVCMLSLSAVITLVALWKDNRAYVIDTLLSIVETNHKLIIWCVILIVTGGIGWTLANRFGWQAKTQKLWSQSRPWLEFGGLGVGLALAAYAYYIRSHPQIPDTFYYWPQDRVIRSYREDTFYRLGWYWQPWGLAIVVIGIGAALRSAKRIWQALAVGLGLVFLVAFVYDIRNNPRQPYAFRRFLPYVTPLMVLGAAVVEKYIPQTWRLTRAWLTVMITAILLGGFWPINEQLNRNAEYSGLTKQVAALADQIPPGAIVLVSGNDPMTRLASCLEFVFGRSCLIVHSRSPLNGRDRALGLACQAWEAQGQTVYLLTADEGLPLAISGVEKDLICRGYIQTKATNDSAKTLVIRQSPLGMHYNLQRLRSSSTSSPPAKPHSSPQS